MRVEKKGRWKGVLAGLAAVILLLCTYLTLCPGRLFLPGLPVGVCAPDSGETGLHTGSAVVFRPGDELYAGALAVWEQDGVWHAGRVAETQEDGTVILSDGRTVAASGVAGRAAYELYVLGALLNALSYRPGSYLVWAADALYVMGWCIWGLTLPRRRHKQRRERFIRLFEQYGAQFDQEEEGEEY